MSKETKFTEGDWKVQDSASSNGDIRVTCSSNQSIATVRNSTSKYFSVDANRDIFNNSLANAHLIKTSPKLYAEIESDLNDLRDRLFDADKKSGDYIHLAGIIKHKEILLAEARGEL